MSHPDHDGERRGGDSPSELGHLPGAITVQGSQWVTCLEGPRLRPTGRAGVWNHHGRCQHHDRRHAEHGIVAQHLCPWGVGECMAWRALQALCFTSLSGVQRHERAIRPSSHSALRTRGRHPRAPLSFSPRRSRPWWVVSCLGADGCCLIRLRFHTRRCRKVEPPQRSTHVPRCRTATGNMPAESTSRAFGH